MEGIFIPGTGVQRQIICQGQPGIAAISELAEDVLGALGDLGGKAPLQLRSGAGQGLLGDLQSCIVVFQ